LGLDLFLLIVGISSADSFRWYCLRANRATIIFFASASFLTNELVEIDVFCHRWINSIELGHITLEVSLILYRFLQSFLLQGILLGLELLLDLHILGVH
jgi:hypothetical protein